MKFEICVRTLDMTSRSYFGKVNSTLGSVLPLSMFQDKNSDTIFQHCRCSSSHDSLRGIPWYNPLQSGLDFARSFLGPGTPLDHIWRSQLWKIWPDGVRQPSWPKFHTMRRSWQISPVILIQIQVAGVEHRCSALPSCSDERERSLQLVPSPRSCGSSDGAVTLWKFLVLWRPMLLSPQIPSQNERGGPGLVHSAEVFFKMSGQ